MASSSSSVGSTAASLTAPPTFSGVSKFAGSLQQVLTRAVGIASLPLDNLQAGLTTLQNQQSAVSSLNSTFASLQQSVSAIQSAVASGLLSTSVSTAGVVSANLQSGALAGTYSIQVNNIGSYSTALSSAGDTPVTTPASQGIATSLPLTLTVGTQATTITPASSSLQDLVTAINAKASGQVQPTIVNVGANGSPDYRLSLQATQLSSDTIDLQDNSGNDLISSSNAGSAATYSVNGSVGTISSSSRTITLAPGLNVTLLSASSGQATNITVAANPSSLATAFTNFATAYNNAATALAQQHGQSPGALSGDSLIQSLQSVLTRLGTYNAGSPASALAAYGVTVDQTGLLSVNTTAFDSAANADFTKFLSVIGTAGTGGFLKSATDLLNGVEDLTSGIIPNEQNQLSSQITNQQSQIARQQATVNTIQTNLTAEISKADSAIASLESQVSYVTGLFAQYTGALSTQSNGLQTL